MNLVGDCIERWPGTESNRRHSGTKNIPAIGAMNFDFIEPIPASFTVRLRQIGLNPITSHYENSSQFAAALQVFSGQALLQKAHSILGNNFCVDAVDGELALRHERDRSRDIHACVIVAGGGCAVCLLDTGAAGNEDRSNGSPESRVK
jgi:hypothetical protein